MPPVACIEDVVRLRKVPATGLRFVHIQPFSAHSQRKSSIFLGRLLRTRSKAFHKCLLHRHSHQAATACGDTAAHLKPCGLRLS